MLIQSSGCLETDTKIGRGLSSDNLFIIKMDELDYLVTKGEKNNKKIIIVILVIIIAIMVSYFLTEKSGLQAKNNSYNAGFNEGVEQWNQQIIYQVNDKQVIPYWYNGTYYELNIAQMCQTLQ